MITISKILLVPVSISINNSVPCDHEGLQSEWQVSYLPIYVNYLGMLDRPS